MNKRQFLQEIFGLWPTVTGDPSGDGDGGGAGGTAGAAGGDKADKADESGTGDKGEPLGAPGLKALQEERTLREQLERRLKELEKSVAPEVLKEAQTRAEQAERELATRARELDLEKQRWETKFGRQVTDEKALREAAEKRELETRIRFSAKEHFAAAGGSDAIDEDGITAFGLFMQAKGQHFRLDENEKLYVVDAQGDPVLDKDGNRIDPKTWITQLADASPTLAGLFKPRQGEGGGTRSSNGTRGNRGLDPHALNHNQLLDAAWAD